MLIYGDRSRRARMRDVLEQLDLAAAGLEAPRDDRAGWIGRHAALVDLFIDAAGLVQAIEDAAFAATGVDRLTPDAEARAGALVDLARTVMLSFETGTLPSTAEARALVARLAGGGPAEDLRIRTAEGYAYYALYPEAYGEAGRVLAGGSPAVLGLRSIGTGLGAMVAAAAGAGLFATLRPVGDVFERRLALDKNLRHRLAARAAFPAAIVDEGPGQSGSSMAGAAAALEELGMPAGKLHFFSSHGGAPGSAATDAVRQRWNTTPRHVRTLDDLAGAGWLRLAAWVEDLTGPAIAPLIDIGGGRWRDHRAFTRRPPGGLMRERRKFLLTSRAGTFLLRFAGLGATGAAAVDRAMRLARAGLTPPVLGLRHGFLVERWLGDAVVPEEHGDDAGLLAHVADYLAFRARYLPAGARDGAPLTELAAMAERNLGLLARAPVDMGALAADAAQLAPRVRRVATDNRLHRWEWLRLPDGRLLKADASDHCAGHDLIGCQDIAWDVVGASVELGLDAAALTAALERRGVKVDTALTAFYRPCYAAFEAGSFYLDASNTSEYPDKFLLEDQILRYLKTINVRQPD